jgi:hypothetical protein
MLKEESGARERARGEELSCSGYKNGWSTNVNVSVNEGGDPLFIITTWAVTGP